MCFIIHLNYFKALIITSLTPGRLSSKIWPIFLVHFQDINTGFFSCRYS